MRVGAAPEMSLIGLLDGGRGGMGVGGAEVDRAVQLAVTAAV